MAELKGKTLLAYVAGIIDGEGCIGLHKNMQYKHPSYTVRVYVGNTNEWLIQFLKIQFGGFITTKKAKDNRNQVWAWELRARKACIFLRLILPYLQMKRANAELALLFQERRTYSQTGLSERRILDEADRILMASYNHRGTNNLMGGKTNE